MRRRVKSLVVSSALVLIGAEAPPDVAPLPVTVPMTSHDVRLTGRFDVTRPDAPRCAWSASAVLLRFHADAVNVLLDDGWTGRYEIFLDGRNTGVLKTRQDQKRYAIASNLTAGDHTLELFKRVEPCFGTTTFHGFELSSGGVALPMPPRSKRKIEIIGDSFSCGYGNDAESRTEHFSAETENICHTYGFIAAQDFDAEFACLCGSGRNLWHTFTIPELYDYTLADTKSPKSDRDDWTPQAVVIALGGNDFAKKAPPEKEWIDTYDQFITHVRVAYPQAIIYLATNPLLTDERPVHRRTTLTAYLNEVVDRRRSEGDDKVHELEFAQQNGDRDGFGADWHPSVKSHLLMSEKLEAAIEHDLGWTPVARVLHT